MYWMMDFSVGGDSRYIFPSDIFDQFEVNFLKNWIRYYLLKKRKFLQFRYGNLCIDSIIAYKYKKAIKMALLDVNIFSLYANR